MIKNFIIWMPSGIIPFCWFVFSQVFYFYAFKKIAGHYIHKICGNNMTRDIEKV